VTIELEPSKFEALRDALAAAGFTFEERPHQVFLARKQGVVVNLYQSGKVTVTPPQTAGARAVIGLIESLGGAAVEKKRPEHPEIKGTRVGTDEVAKGDYFGPLVVAGAMVTEAQAERLRSLGVRDSKSLSATSISNLAVGIRRALDPHQVHIMAISPVKYNLMFEREGSVNAILGWGHAQVLEQVLAFREPCKLAVADQFGDQSHIENALKTRGRDVELLQMPHAEAEVSVAAASILARDASQRAMKELSEEYKLNFPRGAGANVDEFARDLVKEYGDGALLATAKVHFANTGRVASNPDLVLKQAQQLRREAASANPQANSKSYLELYSLISAFEQDIRQVIERDLRAVADEKWWEERVPAAVRTYAEKLRDEERKKGHEATLMECLGMHEYRRIVTAENNWADIYKARCEGDDKGVNAHFGHLYDVRNPVAHTRTVRKEEVFVALSSIRWLRSRVMRDG